MVTQGTVVDPLNGRHEVVDGPSAELSYFHGAPPKQTAVFTLKVPHLPEGGRLRLYTLPASIAEDSDRAKALRKPLADLELPPFEPDERTKP